MMKAGAMAGRYLEPGSFGIRKHDFPWCETQSRCHGWFPPTLALG